MKAYANWFLIAAAGLCLCCKKNADVSADDVSFRYYNLENSGWKSRKITQVVSQNSFIATEVPQQYYLLKEMGVSNLKKVDSIYEAQKTERIYEFSFETLRGDAVLDPASEHFKEAIRYLASDIAQDFYTVVGRDTVPCSGVLFERTFKLKDEYKLLVFFGGIAPGKQVQLVYNDRLFQKGTLKFSFKDRVIKL